MLALMPLFFLTTLPIDLALLSTFRKMSIFLSFGEKSAGKLDGFILKLSISKGIHEHIT